MNTFRLNDAFRYKPSEHHCREGAAVAKDCDSSVVLVDTLWLSGGQDDHVLTHSPPSCAGIEVWGP